MRRLIEVAEELTTAVRRKAGLIPYVHRNNEYAYMFMIPSNAKFGGTEANIAKGVVDDDEDTYEASIREAEEELGFKTSNVAGNAIKVWSGKSVSEKTPYDFYVYAVEVKSEQDFNPPHYETARTVWLTAEEFANEGRQDQRNIVSILQNKLEEKNNGNTYRF